MDILKRDLAPITDAAWEEIESEAKQVLGHALSARRIVDVGKPRGFAHAAVNLGRLDIPDRAADGPVRWGIRRVLPLLEARASFELDVWELDNVERGARGIDLDDLRRAALEIARFEETVIYEGCAENDLEGLLPAAENEPVTITEEPASLPAAVARAVERLRRASVTGPCALALGPGLHRRLHAESDQGYPILEHVESLVGGAIVPAPFLDGGILVSRRGGDTELVLGQDLSIAYEGSDDQRVRLCLTESFAFRVLSPEALVPIQVASTG